MRISNCYRTKEGAHVYPLNDLEEEKSGVFKNAHIRVINILTGKLSKVKADELLKCGCGKGNL